MDLSSLNKSNNEFGNEISKLDEIKFLIKKNIFYIVGVIVFFLFINFLLFSAPNNFPKETIFNIKDKSSLRSLSGDLKNEKIIRSRVIFETLMIILGGEKKFASGDYFFEKQLSVFEVAGRISQGKRNLAPVKVTIPEGFKISEISKTFTSKLANFNENDFLIKAKDKEGYLFPDTYFFLTTDTEEEVLQSMEENFNKKIESLRPKIISSGKKEKEIIIMASILEEESKGDIDRDVISGILWKRIAIGMPLQVDADPNTYKNKGLPQNPISNPGLEAIESAMNPKSSPYLYYLHDKEGNVHYARTFTEHILNKQKYLNK